MNYPLYHRHPQIRPKKMSSASPPKEPDVEPETQSGDDPEQMDRDNQDPSGHGQEFEVKEQDRWLPIANG